MYHPKNLSRTAIPVFLFLAIASLFTTSALAQTLTVSPAVVVFPNAPVGGACPGAGCTYAEVTVTNNGTTNETLTIAAADSPFWPTYGGTCNVTYAYVLPPNRSCTFQWGFKPVRPGRAAAVGTISFESGASLGVLLTGMGTPK